jgi:8-oxo-dGTP pyrophosphatase MutT (NUDIX family)
MRNEIEGGYFVLDLEKVKQDLASRQCRELSLDSLKSAAVLMPYLVKDGKEHILLTVRSQTVANHKGQIAFPGGHQDPGEDLQTTALRETHEEVGIDPSDVEIIGILDDIVTISSYRVRPYLGRVPYPYTYKCSSEEIDEILLVPFEELLDEKNITINSISSNQGEFSVYYFHWNGHVIWGATGRILAQLINLLYGKDL